MTIPVCAFLAYRINDLYLLVFLESYAAVQRFWCATRVKPRTGQSSESEQRLSRLSRLAVSRDIYALTRLTVTCKKEQETAS